MQGVTIRTNLFKAAFSRHFLLTIGLFIVFLAAPFLSKASEEPDEISIFISLQKTGMYIPAILQEETLYLPVSEVFTFLKINNQPSRDSVSGFILDPKNSFLVDFVQQRISYKDTAFTLSGNELIRNETNLFLRSDLFGKVFGLECSFQFRNLAVVINTKLDLPLLRELRQQMLHRNLKKLQGEIKPDTTIRRQYSFLRLGVADWSILHTKDLGSSSMTRMNVQLGGLLAGGEAVVSLNYDSKIPFAQQPQQYQWRFVNNNLKAFKQLILGYIAAQSTASIFAPVRGVQLTNTPTSRRKSFGTYTLSDHTQPDWMVELYVNNVLIDYVKADASGIFTFNVPLVYGNTTIKLKFFGPSGEERSSEKEIRIPFNFLPAHTFEYTLNVGIVKDSLHSLFSKAIFHYGLTNRMTVGGGIEYLSSVKTGSRMPFLYTTVKLPANALLSSEYTQGVRWKNLLTWQLPSQVQLELNYLKYTKGQKAISTTNLEERRAALSMPFRKQDFFLLSKLAVGQVVLPAIGYDSLIKIRYSNIMKLKRTTAELTLSAVVPRFSANLTTAGFFHNRSSSSLYSNLSLAYRLPQGIVFRPQLQYNYSQGQFIYGKLEAEKQLSNQGFVNLSFVKDFSTKVSTVTFGLRYNFSFLRTAFSAVRSNKTTTLVQSAGGSLLADVSTGYIMHSNRNYSGRGSIAIAPFLDINCNGKRDENEPNIRGLRLRIRGGRVLPGEEAVIRIVDLEPYSNYLIELDENSFGNISWQIKNKKISVVIEPNVFKLVEVPVAVVGEASGSVFLENEKGQRGLSRVMVNFFDSTGKLAAQTMTESDGYFSYLGLAPGSYTARVDSAQLRVLDFSSSPASLTFQIAGSEEGVVADGFRFVLQSLHPAAVDDHLDERLPNEKKRQPVVQQKESRMEMNKPATQPRQQPVNSNPSQLPAEQKQKMADASNQQQKAGQVQSKTVDTIRRAESVKQPTKKQSLQPSIKDSSFQNLRKPSYIDSASGSKTLSVVQEKPSAVLSKRFVPVNKKLRLQQQQLSHLANHAFKKVQKVYQKLERLIIEHQRLIAEQKKLRREISELRIKLKQAASKRK